MKNKKSALLILIAFFTLVNLGAETISIKGHAPSYAGDEIVFYTFSDFITFKEKEVGRSKVDTAGHFSFSFESDETIKIFSYLEVYSVYMYAEPGNDYDIRLPVKTLKKPEDQLNPYFKEFIIPIMIAGFKSPDNTPKDKEINTLIKIFNDSFLAYYRKHAMDVAAKTNSDIEESIIHLEDTFGNIDNQFFKDYKDYKYAMLRFIGKGYELEKFINTYFIDRPILYNNPAYYELFGEVFFNFFTTIGATEKGKPIFVNISNQEGILAVKETILKNQKLLKKNEELLNLILLQSIYDGFYAREFGRKAIIALLQSFKENCTSEEQSLIAKNIEAKITKMLPDHAPPAFTLLNSKGEEVTLESYKGRYVYLCFANTNSYSCLNDFEILSVLHEKHKEYLSIVCISMDENFETIKTLATRKKYNWDFLDFNNQKNIASEYNVKAYPTYYLIGPDGKLIMSPAPSPGENFEGHLFNIMRSKGDL